MNNPNYFYNAELLEVLDGDTIKLNIDLGFRCFYKTNIRLFGIDAPAKFGSDKNAGLSVKARVEELLKDKKLIVETFKDKTEKYGRFLGKIYFDENVCLNDLLLEEGLVVKM